MTIRDDLDPRPAAPAGASVSHRIRWAAIGAAVAVTLGAGGLMTATAVQNTGERATFVAITPCRVMDTRPAPLTVGPRATALGAAETHTIQVTGTNGNCTIPPDASAVSMNVTVVGATADSFLTVWPADAPQPVASNLNYVNGQPPTPNAVTVDLSAAGKVSFFNNGGSANVIADVVGYYVDHNHDDRYYTKEQVDAHEAAQKHISVDLSASESNGSRGGGGIGAGLALADTGAYLTLSFTAPADLTPGTTMTLRFRYLLNQTNCTVNFGPGSIYVGRTGETWTTAVAGTDPGLVVVGGTPFPAPPQVNVPAVLDLTLGYPSDGSGLQPGDTVTVDLSRKTTNDTCTAALYLSGAELVYS